jgi:hypothetical protein
MYIQHINKLRLDFFSNFSDVYTAHQQTTTCFKIDFFQIFSNFLDFFSRNFKMTGDGNHDDCHDDDRHEDDRHHDDEQV